MESNNRVIKGFLSSMKVFVLLSLVLCQAVVNPAKPSAQEVSQIQVECLAKRLKCTLVEIQEDKHPLSLKKEYATFSLSLKNEYDKAIAGYAYKLGTSHGQTRTTLRYAIAPGEAQVQQMGIPREWLEEVRPEGLTLTILAVIFVDDTGDGMPEVIKEFQDYHAGARVQVARIHSLMDDYLRKPDDDLLRWLGTLKSEISSLEESEGGDRSFAFRHALHDEKERAINQIEEIESLYNQQGEELYKKFGKDIIRRRLALIGGASKKAEQ